MRWEEALVNAINIQLNTNKSLIFYRKEIIENHLGNLIIETGSAGNTPEQTLSRQLQYLRDKGVIVFLKRGQYELSKEHRSNFEFISQDAKYSLNELLEVDLFTKDYLSVKNSRGGVVELRQAVLENYGHKCSICSIDADELLCASHIARWADFPDHRGNLSNVISFCSLHDTMFENGFFYIGDNREVIINQSLIFSDSVLEKLSEVDGKIIEAKRYNPQLEFIKLHRTRIGVNN